MRDFARNADVLIQEGRRDGERGGDIIETVDFHIRRQVIGGIDFNTQQTLHGQRIFGPVHALNRYVPGFGAVRSSIEIGFHPADEAIDA